MAAPRKHVLVIGGIREIHDALLAKNCRITWFIRRPAMMAGDQSRACHFMLTYEGPGDGPQLIEVAAAIHRKDPFVAVCAFHDEVQLLAAKIAERLGLSYQYQQKTIAQTRDKYKMRLALRRYQLCRARFATVNSLAEIKRMFDQNTHIPRFIIKPLDGTGSAQVRAVSRDEVDALEDSEPLQYPLVAEEFITGVEYSVEGFSDRGRHRILAITEKFKDPDTFIESGHLLPARLDTATRDRIVDYVERCLTALEVASGPTHTEVMVSEDEVALIETHTRTGGDCIPLLVEYATGIDLYRLTAAQALNETIDVGSLDPGSDAYACIRFKIQQPSEAPIKAVEGVAAAGRMAGIKKVSVGFKPGDCLPPVRHSFDRAASALAVADTARGALAAAAAALDEIKFVF